MAEFWAVFCAAISAWVVSGHEDLWQGQGSTSFNNASRPMIAVMQGVGLLWLCCNKPYVSNLSRSKPVWLRFKHVARSVMNVSFSLVNLSVVFLLEEVFVQCCFVACMTSDCPLWASLPLAVHGFTRNRTSRCFTVSDRYSRTKSILGQSIVE